MTAMFVNLPATNLERAKAFYTPIGFTVNPAMSDHNGVCVMVEEGHSYFMILTREYFQTFTDLPLGDPAVSPSVSTAIFLDSRHAVDGAVTDGIAAGGVEPHPATDYGFSISASSRPRRQHPGVRLDGPGRRPGARGLDEPDGLSTVVDSGRTRLRAVRRHHEGAGTRG
jgi:predicted lactoylglutathione lyase